MYKYRRLNQYLLTFREKINNKRLVKLKDRRCGSDEYVESDE